MTLRTFGDMYCWCCHLEDAMYSCKKCARSYHRRCVFEMPNYPEPLFNPESMDPSSMDSCPECVAADETVLYSMKNVLPPQLNYILHYVIGKLKSDDFMFENYYDIPKPKAHTRSRAVIVKFMDILTLEKNVKHEVYKSLEGFFGDAKWIRHNVAVLSGRKSDEMTNVEKLIHLIASEMLTIDLCHECYVRKQGENSIENLFITACSRPHLLGWAKTDGITYWPVKIMGIDLGKKIAIVHTFGEHKQLELPLRDCLIYSHDSPSSNRRLQGQLHGWKKACKEMRRHMELVEEKHGKVVLAEEKVRIRCTLSEAVQRMFPDWKLKIMNATALKYADEEELERELEVRDILQQASSADDESSSTDED
ncbi:Protein kinase C-binding protein 1 [Orchesella cincta]|uniref:Protein kinase C-binding protein 1 n=1 Tax=Orchesella cincta TaxID=48709 RepID=A0A1D2MIW7_ORCCI|nr:Protein kinase C-binding protein 1 [Orchesella cincta]